MTATTGGRGRRAIAAPALLALVVTVGSACGRTEKRAVHIPRPKPGATVPSRNLPRGPEMPPDTAGLDDLYHQGKVDVLK